MAENRDSYWLAGFQQNMIGKQEPQTNKIKDSIKSVSRINIKPHEWPFFHP